MKPTFNKYWILIAIIVVMNVFVFVVLSNKLESFVADKMIEDQKGNEML